MSFETNDNVICINDKQHSSLIKGKIYTVLGKNCCTHCKALVLDVGLVLDTPSDFHFCLKCYKKSVLPDPNAHYAYATRFIKLDNLLEDCQWEKEEEGKELTQKQKVLRLLETRELLVKTREKLIKILEED